MTAPETAVLRARLAREIQHRAGVSADAGAVAAASHLVHDEIIAVLAPLISGTGVEALSSRAFDLAQREFPGGRDSGDDVPAGEPFRRVGRWLESHDASAATRVAAAMFATFAELLTTLIGEPLTSRYLDKVWKAEAPDSPTQEDIP